MAACACRPPRTARCGCGTWASSAACRPSPHTLTRSGRWLPRVTSGRSSLAAARAASTGAHPTSLTPASTEVWGSASPRSGRPPRIRWLSLLLPCVGRNPEQRLPHCMCWSGLAARAAWLRRTARSRLAQPGCVHHLAWTVDGCRALISVLQDPRALRRAGTYAGLGSQPALSSCTGQRKPCIAEPWLPALCEHLTAAGQLDQNSCTWQRKLHPHIRLARRTILADSEAGCLVSGEAPVQRLALDGSRGCLWAATTDSTVKAWAVGLPQAGSQSRGARALWSRAQAAAGLPGSATPCTGPALAGSSAGSPAAAREQQRLCAHLRIAYRLGSSWLADRVAHNQTLPARNLKPSGRIARRRGHAWQAAGAERHAQPFAKLLGGPVAPGARAADPAARRAPAGLSASSPVLRVAPAARAPGCALPGWPMAGLLDAAGHSPQLKRSCVRSRGSRRLLQQSCWPAAVDRSPGCAAAVPLAARAAAQNPVHLRTLCHCTGSASVGLQQGPGRTRAMVPAECPCTCPSHQLCSQGSCCRAHDGRLPGASCGLPGGHRARASSRQPCGSAEGGRTCTPVASVGVQAARWVPCCASQQLTCWTCAAWAWAQGRQPWHGLDFGNAGGVLPLQLRRLQLWCSGHLLHPGRR